MFDNPKRGHVMIVTIFEKERGKIIARYPVDVKGMNYIPLEDEYIDRAWQCAIEDGAVDSDSRENYSFKISEG